MVAQGVLLLTDHASYMTGGEYFIDGWDLAPIAVEFL